MFFTKIKSICKQEQSQESEDIEKFQSILNFWKNIANFPVLTVEKGMSKSSTETTELASQLESELMKPESEVCVKEHENGSKKSDNILSLNF